nr:AAWKG family protein [Streptomyces sp. NBC_00974]
MADTDYWAKVVKQFTGYPVPSRETLFKKSNEETPQTPLFGLELHPTTKIQAVNLNEIGWTGSKSDEYALTFYTTNRGDGAHTGVAMVRAKIHLAAAPRDASVGGVLDTRMRSTETALAQYVWGSKAALDRLYSQHTTEGFDRNGLIVASSDVVDLKSFDRMARAFDRTKRFFEVQADTLKQWEKSFGAEQASWKGQAAQVFRDLVAEVHKNYESYLTQLGGRNYAPVHVPIHGDPASSRLGDAVIGAQQDVIRNIRYLRGAWDRWAADGKHIPHQWFLEELEKLQQWLFQNNITQVLSSRELDDDGGQFTQYSTTAAFQQNYPGYGDLSNPATWTKIGDAAIQRWSTHAEAAIAQHAKSALSNLNNHWLDAATAFDEPLQTKSTSSPSQSWQQSQAQALGVTAQGLNGALDGARGAISGPNGNTIGQSGLGAAGLEQRASNLNAVLDGLGADPATKGNLPNSRNGASSDTGRSADTSGFTDTLAARSLAALNSIPAGAVVPRPDFGTTGTDSLKNPGGGSTTRTTDGSLVTSYPDGVLSLLNPATGLLATTSQDGKTAKTTLTPGVAVTNPDGSRSTLKPDGSVDTTFADGTVQSIGSDGTVSTTRPDGSVTTTQLNPAAGSFSTPGGGNARLNADGSLSTLFPGGVTETVDPRTGTVTTTSPDGTTSTSLLNRGAEFTHPDGSITTLDRDGSLTTVFPDGTTQTVGSDGALTTTRPDGSVTTTQLNPAANAFTPSGGRSVPELPDPYSFQPGEAAVNSGVSGFSSLNSGGLESSSLDSTTVPAAAGASSYEEYDSTPYSGGSLRAPAAESTDSAASAAGGGVPLNPMAMGGMGGMGMGGMGGGGMGGGGGGGSNSERVRNVLSDNDGAALRRSRSRTARADEEEDVVFTRGGRPVTTSSTPYLPAGTPSGQGGQSTESGDRRRAGWVQEEEDVWGKDEGGAPAVIGR